MNERPTPDAAPDAIDAPLGLAPASPARRVDGRLVLLGLAGLAAGAFGVALALVEPKAPGGRPQATAKIEQAPAPTPAPAQVAAATAAAQAGGGSTQIARTGAAGVEEASGVKVHRPGGAGPPGALIIQVPEAAPALLRLQPAPDRRLVEKGPHGPLPRIGADGSRPAEVYARPVMTGGKLKPGAPRVAIYVGGLGLAAGPTQAAIKLPEAISLAFAPYGADLARDVAAAREDGHEVLLQAPMEPLDYPANDPGPNTLLAGDPAAKTIDRLHWLMSRFQGYVGVVAFLGGRFLGDEAALAPVLADIGKRGLFYVEDQGAARSRAAALAPGLKLPLLRADVTLDRNDRPEAIEAGLSELEKIAREKGVAVGAASALPNTLARLQRWASALESRGIALVPVSAAAQAADRRGQALSAAMDGPRPSPTPHAGYRPCVGVMLINAQGLVFVGRRREKKKREHVAPGFEWQMPQGGVDPGEDPAAAARRELYEETNVRSVAPLAEAPGWFAYDLPSDIAREAWKGRWLGQTQKWFALRFTGAESEIDIAAPAGCKPEFDAWRWARVDELPGLIIPFKRPVYERVVAAFGPLAAPR